MARRSYFQRIAEPLVPGKPVLSAVPRPAVDEARPAAAAPGIRPSPVPAAETPAPVLRRSPADGNRPVAGYAPARPGAIAAAAPAATQDVSAPGAVSLAAPAPAVSPATDGVEAVEPAPRLALSDDVGLPRDFGAPAGFPDFEPGVPEVARDSVARPLADGPPLEPVRRAEPPAPDAPVDRWADAPAARMAPTAPTAEPVARTPAPPATWPGYPPAPIVAVNPSANLAGPAHIHIGTIEIRSTPPQAPAPQPPPAPARAPAAAGSAFGANAAAPVSRGYGWRFGLIQG